MALLLGVDTGGTYTDAVLIRDETQVVASAKALTTRADLAVGIGAAVGSVLERSGVRPGEVALVSLSTTLATNALVEGHGGRVALVYVGFPASDLDRHGLSEALNGDPVAVLAGGHGHDGAEAAALDEAALAGFVETHGTGVTGFAVASRFATRNPAHERRAAQMIAEASGAPVTCSHQLSARLNGPKRALTAVLNARLVGMIDRLIARAQSVLDGLGLTAPLMVVRGDGALMSAEQARARPIETILSGPAASIVGARWLTGAQDALVSDIGGTTTDVAILRGGRPAIDPDGARVGGFRTMVEAVAMRTTGLGGDSEVHPRSEGLAGGVTLGPRRLVPVALIAAEAPEAVHRALDRQLRSVTPGEMDARFLRAVPGIPASGLDDRAAALLARIGDAVQPLGAVLGSRMDRTALRRLSERGLVQLAGVTPTDAAHVLGVQTGWDAGAADKALALMARKRIGSGDRLAPDAASLARVIAAQLTDQTVQALLEAALAGEGADLAADLATHPLLQRGLDGHRGLLALDAAVNVDVVGLGASAPTWYPAVGDRLRARMVLPEHAGVANAIGAVAGRIAVRRSGTVTAPAAGRYRAHLTGGPEDFADPEAALARLEAELRNRAEAAARGAGADEIELHVTRDIRTATVEARGVFVEAQVTAEASGRPRIALG
ncbi:hydantoinase/oxoprolinase N-terminal domain-containing protein [Pukyongiella litopenaei]|uniref:Hydantoinase/oxoprolinase family protein n=1 Tax=Pukyongiella litopenaei TaxID=2605946 RepID=A0A2S0MNX5_9RHOB|nr:hydantoinase/oxoprolinase family protein [Pukyongiella litopenaei]AVO37589.1 hydantoinase/oxoprolinase family protein [Pukyongiella litopenaei]